MGPRDVVGQYEALINRHDFDLLVPLISADAVFWFNDGSFVGLDAIRAAFEQTWSSLANDTYRLDDMAWPAIGDTAACCTYRFNWQTVIGGVSASGNGRGTTVLRLERGMWKIVHEHLSHDPRK